ncbi:hypothetical protein [Trinickia fusca]|uniref:Uncharacterized protein n=1 Tax=Trinickia fusca TaxID=2419777 RepID=A0A494XEP1_9BURK|nr:hypothetical protein [Trinickia fusca]RKP46946.1 hypothetical protein D7S89_16490 [Trinickia fusca]
MESVPGLPWYAIRNGSDPEIQNTNDNMTEAGEQASQIYAKYGGLVTAARVIATWGSDYFRRENGLKRGSLGAFSPLQLCAEV